MFPWFCTIIKFKFVCIFCLFLFCRYLQSHLLGCLCIKIFHPIFCILGHYIYLEASSPAKQGYKGRLLSRIFKHGMTKCLVFYYFMYGSDMGTLRVLLYGIRSNAKEVLWQTSGDKGHKWKEQAISVRAEEDFKVCNDIWCFYSSFILLLLKRGLLFCFQFCFQFADSFRRWERHWF